jgi:hypothetical protein
MPGIDASEAFRYAMDWGGLALASITSVSPYSSYVVQTISDLIDFDDNSTPITTITRLLIADGFRPYAPNDGYLNPMLKQESGSQFTISQGQLTNNTLVLGPIVFPYTYNGFTGGVDTAIYQPPTKKTSIFIQIRGPGLSTSGNLFNIKEIIIDGMAGLSYSLQLQANMKPNG